MTLIKKLRITLDEVTKAASKAMANAQNEQRLIFIYSEALAICQMIASTPIPIFEDIYEEEFFKVHEDAAQNIWNIFTENLKRVDSKILKEPAFQLLDPGQIFAAVRKGKTPFIMRPAEMFQ